MKYIILGFTIVYLTQFSSWAISDTLTKTEIMEHAKEFQTVSYGCWLYTRMNNNMNDESCQRTNQLMKDMPNLYRSAEANLTKEDKLEVLQYIESSADLTFKTIDYMHAVIAEASK